MAGEWREVTVQEIAAASPNALVGGPFGSNLVSADYVDDGVPVIRGQNMGGRWVSGEFAQVSGQKAASLSANIARPGDLIFTQRGTLGQVSLVPTGPHEKYVISQSQMKLTANQSVAHPLFLYYAFSSDEQVGYIKANAIQTGVPHTNLGILRQTPLLLPPVEEQRRIARILGSLDDKIELNRRMSETLEAMARALFKSWFVDFGPVRAKAESRATGLPKDIDELFPTKFEASAYGPVPVGWRYRPLGEVVELVRGTTYKSSLKDQPGPVLLGLSAIERNGGFRSNKLSTYGGSSPGKLVLGPGDLFASLKDVTQAADLLGAVARVPSYIASGRLTQDTVKLAFTSEGASRNFVYLTLLGDSARDHCRAHATGTTNLGLSREDFLAIPIPEPGEGLRRVFDRIMDHTDRRRSGLAEEARLLLSLRDALLPELIGGRIHSPSTEGAVGLGD